MKDKIIYWQLKPKQYLFWGLLIGLFSLAGLSCSLFGSDNKDNDDICGDIAHEWADVYYGEVSQAQCQASERGEWFPETGRCYCHGLI